MKANRQEILKKLEEKGLFLDVSVEAELLTSYDFFLQSLVNNETKLLEEILRIQEKADNKEELSYLEEVFYKYVTTKYKK